jgi:malate dehydrogenase (oxaloacetate-decarboxylating)
MDYPTTSASNAVTFRLKLGHSAGALAKITTAIASLGGNIGAIDIIRVEDGNIIRDITVETSGEEHAEEIKSILEGIKDTELIHVSDRTLLMHLGGKIEVNSKIPIKTRDELSMAYTPGVAKVCMAIHEDKSKAFNLTIKRNTVAVVSDGSAVLGLGNIGPEAAMPVMEGKAMLFKDFAGVDAFPICLDTQDTEEIISIVKSLAPTFGGINLEDISAPRCFEIEKRLDKELNIPVFHDDQHGTAVVMIAALINALKITGKKAKDLKVIVLGVGAAGTACTDMMLSMGITDIIGLDRKGAIYEGRESLNAAKEAYAQRTNPGKVAGTISEVIKDIDVVVGVSGPGLLTLEHVKSMAKDPIIFAMSNPTPEITPEEVEGHVEIMATGRSDYPNQINNVLCFPGLFRGALDCQIDQITENIKMAAAQAIANCISEKDLSPSYIIPSVFDKSVAPAVAKAVTEEAKKAGIARRSGFPRVR